jgi:hypothetical protein
MCMIGLSRPKLAVKPQHRRSTAKTPDLNAQALRPDRDLPHRFRRAAPELFRGRKYHCFGPADQGRAGI